MRSLATLWVGNEMPAIERACLETWANSGREVIIYTYERVKNLPQNAIEFDAREILPEDEVFQNPNGLSYAGFSNIFRYKLQVATDHIWIDADVAAGGRELEDREYMLGWESRNYVNGALLKIPASSALLSEIETRASKVDRAAFKWGELGPKLITGAVIATASQPMVSPRRNYYPISAFEIWKLYDKRQAKRVTKALEEAQANHIWSEAFKTAPFDTSKVCPQDGSYLYRILTATGQKIDFEKEITRIQILLWQLKLFTMRIRAHLK